MINITAEMLTQMVMAVGILAFVVSIITEVLKGLSFMKKVPTDLVVILLSMVLTVVAFVAYAQCVAMALTWYMVVAAILCGFFVAFIAMYGWTKLTELWSRFKPNKNE